MLSFIDFCYYFYAFSFFKKKAYFAVVEDWARDPHLVQAACDCSARSLCGARTRRRCSHSLNSGVRVQLCEVSLLVPSFLRFSSIFALGSNK